MHPSPLHLNALRFPLICLSIFLTTLPGFAEVSLPKFFSDNMVLQRDTEVPVWGWAEPDQSVEVTFGSQTQRTRADESGNWRVRLDAMPASHEGRELVVNNKLRLKNVLVGDVWLCSGQSNMEWTVRGALNPKEEVAAADYPSIRHIKIDRATSPVPLKDVRSTKGWEVCQPDRVGEFTAVGYFFGRELYQQLDVPIGLVNSSWGGTVIQPWTAPEGFHGVPELASVSEKIKTVDPSTEQGREAHLRTIQEVEKWLAAAKTSVAAGAYPDELPTLPAIGTGGRVPTFLYNAMIHPLTPMPIQGAVWYQGESNDKDGMIYFHKMKALIQGWREVWSQGGAFPFYFVQLANFKNSPDKPEGGDGWAVLREAQRRALELDHTGMAVAIDIGEAKDIHPKNKQDVGKRLARWALADTYGKDIVPSGPLFEKISIQGDKVRVHFKYVGSGLMVGRKGGLEPTGEVPGGTLKEFAIAGDDKVWHWADALIEGDTVVVSSKDVSKPVAVRYAYRMNPSEANLYNKEGLPASPFRSDNW
jgi:sialate O-acetylesterase